MSDRWHAVLESLRARFGAEVEADELETFLASEGYSRRDIGAIVDRFRAQSPAASVAQTGADSTIVTPRRPAAAVTAVAGIRVLGPHEWGRFTPDAWGRLLSLSASGLIGMQDFERLVERALEQGDGRVDLGTVRAMLFGLGLTEPNADGDPLTIH